MLFGFNINSSSPQKLIMNFTIVYQKLLMSTGNRPADETASLKRSSSAEQHALNSDLSRLGSIYV